LVRAGLISILFGLAAAPLPASDNAIASSAGSLQDFSRKLSEESTGLDWDKEFRFIERNLDRLWHENSWNDEADRFALQIARDVSAVPPWKIFDRFNIMAQHVSQRYELSGVEGARFKTSLIREAGGILVRHSGTILKHAQEMMALGRENRPITSEHVAKWIKEGMPVLAETHESIDRLGQELFARLPQEKRAVLERDLVSYTKRRKYVDETVARWAEGGWKPSEWGLEGDGPRPAAQVDLPREPPPLLLPDAVETNKVVSPPQVVHVPKWLAHDPATWFAYVLEIKDRYQLNGGQFTAARSIHDELFSRAAAFDKAHGPALSAVRYHERAGHEAYAPIRGLFEELRGRLEALPTTAQRADVKNGPKPQTP